MCKRVDICLYCMRGTRKFGSKELWQITKWGGGGLRGNVCVCLYSYLCEDRFKFKPME